MSTTTYFGSAEAQAARSLIGGTAIGDTRNELLKQILVATANKTSGPSGVAWGAITGTLGDQTDLANALAAKLDLAGGTITPAANTTALTLGGSLTGANAQNSLELTPTWNTTGNPALIYGRVTNTASGASAKLLDLGTVAGGSLFSVSKEGYPIAPAGGFTTASLRMGSANTGFSASGSTTRIDAIINGNQSASIDLSGFNVYSPRIATGKYSFNVYGFTGPEMRSGAGTPEGAVTADPGSVYLRNNGGAGTSFYVKESGTGNTGWVAK